MDFEAQSHASVINNTAGFYGQNSYQPPRRGMQHVQSVTAGHQIIVHPPPEPPRPRVNHTYVSQVFSGPAPTFRPRKGMVPGAPAHVLHQNATIQARPEDLLLADAQRPPGYRRGKPDQFCNEITRSDAFDPGIQRPETKGALEKRARRNPTNRSNVLPPDNQPLSRSPKFRSSPTFDSHTSQQNFSDKSGVSNRVSQRRVRAPEHCYADNVATIENPVHTKNPTNIRGDGRTVRKKALYSELGFHGSNDIFNPERPAPVYHPARAPVFDEKTGQRRYMDPPSKVFDKVEPFRRRQLGPSYDGRHASDERLNMQPERIITPNTRAAFEKHNDILGLARLPQRVARQRGEYVNGPLAAAAHQRDNFYDRMADAHPLSPQHATANRVLQTSPMMQRSASSPALGRNSPSWKSPGNPGRDLMARRPTDRM